MRIGEFAKKHNTTLDTIRHYLDMGLLVTEKSGGQYRFSEKDSWDFEMILELKDFDFTLLEIQSLLGHHRLTGGMASEYREYYLSLLKSKGKYLNSEINRYKSIVDSINQKIKSVESKEDYSSILGLPIYSADILNCPLCRNRLDMENGIIEKNMIMKGKLKCACGFNASIENGIYYDERVKKKKTLGKGKMPSRQEYLESGTQKFINFYYNGMSRLREYILRYSQNPRYILELAHCTGSFLMHHIKYLPDECTYILVCYDEERLLKLKRDLELQYNHKKIIFLCCDIDKIPIANLSMDLVIDHYMTKDFLLSYQKTFVDIFAPLIRRDGLLLGTYPYFDKRSNDYMSLSDPLKEVYDKEKNMTRLNQANIEELESIELEPVIENNPYNLDIKGRKLHTTVYIGKKK